MTEAPAMTTIDRIKAALAAGPTPGPWIADYMGGCIGCENAKIGGFAKLFDVRGWGYLTGNGHGALGLSHEEGAAVQNANRDFVIACNPAAISELIASHEDLERQVAALSAALQEGENPSPQSHVEGREPAVWGHYAADRKTLLNVFYAEPDGYTAYPGEVIVPLRPDFSGVANPPPQTREPGPSSLPQHSNGGEG